MTILRTLNHRFFRLRPRRLGGALVATGGVLLGGGIAVGGPGAAIGVGIVAVHADSNNGDFWVQNSGTDPSAEDPHLDCADITLFGNDINGATGSFEIDLKDPSGSGDSYDGTWVYDQDKGGAQAIATIKEADLAAGAVENGADATSRLHFKIELPIFPNKHKTFWIDCSPSTPTPTPTDAPTPTPTATPTPTPSSSSSSTTTTGNGGVEGTGGQNPPGTGTGTTTTTTSAPTTSAGTSTGNGAAPIAASVPEHQLSTPSAGADIPFVSGFLLLLAGGGLLGADARRGRRRRQR